MLYKGYNTVALWREPPETCLKLLLLILDQICTSSMPKVHPSRPKNLNPELSFLHLTPQALHPKLSTILPQTLNPKPYTLLGEDVFGPNPPCLVKRGNFIWQRFGLKVFPGTNFTLLQNRNIIVEIDTFWIGYF